MKKIAVIILLLFYCFSCKTENKNEKEIEFETLNSVVESIITKYNLTKSPEVIIDSYWLNYDVIKKSKHHIIKECIGSCRYYEKGEILPNGKKANDNGTLNILFKFPKIIDIENTTIELDGKKISHETYLNLDLNSICKKTFIMDKEKLLKEKKLILKSKEITIYSNKYYIDKIN